MAIADKARDFWERISVREKRLVVIGAIAAPLTLALWLGLSIHDGLEDIAARNDKTRHALEVLADLSARGGATQTPVDDVVATMGTEPLSLDTYLNKAAQKAGIPLKSTRPKPAQTRNGFVTNVVSIDLEPMTIDEMKTFLQEIETQSKFVQVTRLDISRNHSKSDKVDVHMDVSTYSRDKQEEAAGSGGSATGSGGNSGSSGSSGTGGSGKGG